MTCSYGSARSHSSSARSRHSPPSRRCSSAPLRCPPPAYFVSMLMGVGLALALGRSAAGRARPSAADPGHAPACPAAGQGVSGWRAPPRRPRPAPLRRGPRASRELGQVRQHDVGAGRPQLRPAARPGRHCHRQRAGRPCAAHVADVVADVDRRAVLAQRRALRLRPQAADQRVRPDAAGGQGAGGRWARTSPSPPRDGRQPAHRVDRLGARRASRGWPRCRGPRTAPGSGRPSPGWRRARTSWPARPPAAARAG